MTEVMSAATRAGREGTARARLLGEAARRIEFGDALVFVYIIAFARQSLWALDSNAAAWVLSAVAALAGFVLYVRTKPFLPERTGASFWLIAALPLAFVYALRAPFPDPSFDVLNYRLFHAERALRGPLFAPGDFFPTPVPFNPSPDIVTGLFRHALGYRLGTVVNLLALVWGAQVVDRILRPRVRGPRARAACVMLVFLAEHLLFEVNTYLVDLLSLPLLCEAVYLLLRADETEQRVALYVRVALLMGTCTAFKMANLPAVLPVVLACAALALAGRARLAPRELPRAAVLALAAFAAPLLPFCAQLYAELGAPLFPFFNKIFKSPYWPAPSGWDARWGPAGAFETLLWPLVSFFKPERLSELGVYSGRAAFGFAVSVAGLALGRRDARLLTLCAINLLALLLWSAAGWGYIRYGLFPEILSGVVVVAVAARLAAGSGGGGTLAMRALASLLVAALAAQAALACHYVSRYEWGMRPTAFSNFAAYAAESRQLLRDRRLTDYLPPEARAQLSGGKVWADACIKSNGIEALLDASAPALGVRHHEFFVSRASRRRFVEAVGGIGDRPVFALCLPAEEAAARQVIESRGLSVAGAEPLRVPFFSEALAGGGLTLIRIEPPRGERAAAWAALFLKHTALPDAAYRAEISTASAPRALRPGEKRTLIFKVRNAGGAAWPARGTSDGRFQVNLGDRWLDPGTGVVVSELDRRTALTADLAPGAEIELPLTVQAPARPGEYVLEVDMVHEGVAFFGEKGSRTLRLRVRVG